MKKLISIFLILCLALSVVACNKDDSKDTGKEVNNETNNEVIVDPEDVMFEANYDNAIWEGYTESSFVEFINTAMENYKKSEPDTEATIHDMSVVTGWEKSDDLDESADLSEGCEAITYIIKASEDGTDADIYVFMEYDKSENTVSVKGGFVDGYVIAESYTKEEAEHSLNVGKALFENEDALKVEVVE